MCDLKANLNINMSLLCKLITLLILIIKQSNQSFTVLYLMIIIRKPYSQSPFDFAFINLY